MACGTQAFIATLLFDHSMSALPIVEMQKSQSVGCSPANRGRGLGLNRRETGWFYPTDDVMLLQ